MVTVNEQLNAIVNSETSLTDLVNQLVGEGVSEAEINQALTHELNLKSFDFTTKGDETYLVR